MCVLAPEVSKCIYLSQNFRLFWIPPLPACQGSVAVGAVRGLPAKLGHYGSP